MCVVLCTWLCRIDDLGQTATKFLHDSFLSLNTGLTILEYETYQCSVVDTKCSTFYHKRMASLLQQTETGCLSNILVDEGEWKSAWGQHVLYNKRAKYIPFEISVSLSQANCEKTRYICSLVPSPLPAHMSLHNVCVFTYGHLMFWAGVWQSSSPTVPWSGRWQLSAAGCECLAREQRHSIKYHAFYSVNWHKVWMNRQLSSPT